jgi:hypothetical protein
LVEGKPRIGKTVLAHEVAAAPSRLLIELHIEPTTLAPPRVMGANGVEWRLVTGRLRLGIERMVRNFQGITADLACFAVPFSPKARRGSIGSMAGMESAVLADRENGTAEHAEHANTCLS